MLNAQHISAQSICSEESKIHIVSASSSVALAVLHAKPLKFAPEIVTDVLLLSFPRITIREHVDEEYINLFVPLNRIPSWLFFQLTFLG